MRKLFLMAAMASALWSCSDDDAPVYYPGPVPVVSKITVVNNSETVVYDVHYDAQRRISQMDRHSLNNETGYLFEYDANNRITKFTAAGDSPNHTDYLYSESGILLSYNNAFDGETTLKYNPVEKLYYNGPDYRFSFFDNGDINRKADFYYHYAEGKKGAFANVNASYHFLGIASFDTFFDAFSSKKPIESATSGANQTLVTVQNTYNADGYVTDMAIGGSTVAIHFEYTMVY